MILYWEISALPLIFKPIFVETKLKNHLVADLISDFIFGFSAILSENKKFNIPGISFYFIIPHSISCDHKLNNVYDNKISYA